MIGDAPQALVVELARLGDRAAFGELVRRKQSWLRNLMRRCCTDRVLADDLAQQVLLQAWRDITRLREPKKFDAWLQRLAINVWRQSYRKRDVLAEAATTDSAHTSDSLTHSTHPTPGAAVDLDAALAELSDAERLCVVLAYHEGQSHREISDSTGWPLGTVKSHVRRGSARLQTLLSAYNGELR